jgi:hypothetical protein
MVEKEKDKPRKRIYNPVTGKYYEVRQRTTKIGKKGQIKGLWHTPKKKKRKESIWDLLG